MRSDLHFELCLRSHFLANSPPFLCRVRSDPAHGRSVANNGGTSVPRGGVKETEAQETIQREPYLTGDSFPPRLILAFGMSKSSPFRPLCCPDRKRICKQDPGHGLHIVRGRCIVHKSLFRSHFGAIMPDFPRTRIGTEAPTATQQGNFWTQEHRYGCLLGKKCS